MTVKREPPVRVVTPETVQHLREQGASRDLIEYAASRVNPDPLQLSETGDVVDRPFDFYVRGYEAGKRQRPGTILAALVIGLLLGLAAGASIVKAATLRGASVIPAVETSRPGAGIGEPDQGRPGAPHEHFGVQSPTWATNGPGCDDCGSPLPILGGYATWYDDGPGLYAAAGPALRFGDWRGRAVSVCYVGSCVAVVLSDFCACGDRNGRATIIDLSPAAFRELAPLSRGVILVEVMPLALPETSTR